MANARACWLSTALACLAAVAIVSTTDAQTIAPSPLSVNKDVSVAGATALRFDPLAYDAIKVTDRLLLQAFPIDEERHVDLELRRMDVLAPGAQLIVQGLKGARQLSPPDVATFTGQVSGDRTSRVFLALSPHGSHAFIELEGATYVLSSGPSGAERDPVIYNLSETTSDFITWADFSCGAEALGVPRSPAGTSSRPMRGTCQTAQMALDTDFEYTSQVFGGDTEAAATYAVALLAGLSVIYESVENVLFEVVYLRLWEDPADPWDGADVIEQVIQFHDYWEAQMGHIDRDLAHLLGGRDLIGGAAYGSGLCIEGEGYGISTTLTGFFPYPLQDNHPQNFDIVLIGHEVGHNFGAIHTHSMDPPIDNCPGGDCSNASEATLMSYCINCPGGIANYRLAYHERNLNEFILPLLASAECEGVLDPCVAVPAVSAWGMVVMMLLLLTGVTWILRYRRTCII